LRAPPAPFVAISFNKKFDWLEEQRTSLLARLNALNTASDHPAYRRAQSLLNTTFRKTKLRQRASVLQAAQWLIEVLDRLTTLV
jgi:hypothetical protein